jgi:TolB-like protein
VTGSVPGRKIVPWLVAIIAVAGTAAIWLLVYNLRRSAKVQTTTLAVLPFTDESAQRDQQYFSDGITEDLTQALALMPALRIPAAESTFRLRDATVAEAGRQLQVEMVLKGSVRREGGRVHINAQLVRVADNANTWSQSFDEPASAVVDAGQKLSRAVIGELGAGAWHPSRTTNSAVAYELYLHGLESLRKAGGGPSPEAAEYFKQAIGKDESFPRAYLGLAQAYDLTPEARAAALRALTLDESLGEAHVALARVLLWDDADWSTAEKELNRAKIVSPQCAEADVIAGLTFAYRLNSEQARAEMMRAVELNPLSARVRNAQALVALLTRDMRGSIAAARTAIELDPKFLPAYETLGRALVLTGATEEGITALRESGAQGSLGWAYGTAGQSKEARAVLRELTQQKEPPAFAIAQVYAGLDDREETFRWLERVLQSGAAGARGQVANIVGPDWDRVRSDARYAAALKKIGL